VRECKQTECCVSVEDAERVVLSETEKGTTHRQREHRPTLGVEGLSGIEKENMQYSCIHPVVYTALIHTYRCYLIHTIPAVPLLSTEQLS
jgi:hypothetical protein